MLWKKYGIRLEDYERMYELQDGCCKICLREEEQLDVDHCHDTGIIRGLLCGLCNRGLGMLQENFIIIRRAAEYVLEKGNI